MDYPIFMNYERTYAHDTRHTIFFVVTVDLHRSPEVYPWYIVVLWVYSSDMARAQEAS